MYSMYSVLVKFHRSESSAGRIAAGAKSRAQLQCTYMWRNAGARIGEEIVYGLASWSH